MVPKTGTQVWQQNWTQIRPQNAIRGAKFVRRTCRHDLHSMVFYLAILFNCAQQTNNINNFNQRRGKLRPAKLLKQRAFLHLHTKHGQDIFSLQKILKQVKFHVWKNQQHARYCEVKLVCFLWRGNHLVRVQRLFSLNLFCSGVRSRIGVFWHKLRQRRQRYWKPNPTLEGYTWKTKMAERCQYLTPFFQGPTFDLRTPGFTNNCTVSQSAKTWNGIETKWFKLWKLKANWAKWLHESHWHFATSNLGQQCKTHCQLCMHIAHHFAKVTPWKTKGRTLCKESWWHCRSESEFSGTKKNLRSRRWRGAMSNVDGKLKQLITSKNV